VAKRAMARALGGMRRAGWASAVIIATAVQAGAPLPGWANAQDGGSVDPNGPDTATATVPDDPPRTFNPKTVADGKKVYQAFCEKCHGRDMVSSGGAFFDLRTFPSNDRQRFVNSVTNGKRAMPEWGSVLKQADIEELWAYVSSQGRPQ
jgi:mono/diheme cytochrome c family protein